MLRDFYAIHGNEFGYTAYKVRGKNHKEKALISDIGKGRIFIDVTVFYLKFTVERSRDIWFTSMFLVQLLVDVVFFRSETAVFLHCVWCCNFKLLILNDFFNLF